MAFDGGFLHTVVQELQQAIDCHVDKIYQPARDVLVLSLRKKGFVKRLVISAASGTARVHFTVEHLTAENTRLLLALAGEYI